jgi:hypothetical protein
MEILISLVIGWFLCRRFYDKEISADKAKLAEPKKQQLNG